MFRDTNSKEEEGEAGVGESGSQGGRRLLPTLPKALLGNLSPGLGGGTGESHSPGSLAASSSGLDLGQPPRVAAFLARVVQTDTQHSHACWPCVRVWSLDPTLTRASVFLQNIPSCSDGPQQHLAQLLAMTMPHTLYGVLDWAQAKLLRDSHGLSAVRGTLGRVSIPAAVPAGPRLFMNSFNPGTG